MAAVLGKEYACECFQFYGVACMFNTTSLLQRTVHLLLYLLRLSPLLQSYMNPLTELAQGPSPILDSDQVEHLFGPITQVARHCHIHVCNCL